MRVTLWRVSSEQMRAATQEESQGCELVNQYLHDLRVDLKNTRRPRRYVDVQREEPPRFPGDPSYEELKEPLASKEESPTVAVGTAVNKEGVPQILIDEHFKPGLTVKTWLAAMDIETDDLLTLFAFSR